jgi:hypothetical protein
VGCFHCGEPFPRAPAGRLNSTAQSRSSVARGASRLPGRSAPAGLTAFYAPSRRADRAACRGS